MPRRPRTPMLTNRLLATYAEAEEKTILEVMKDWPDQMAEALKAHGIGEFSEVGHVIWRDKFEHELATNPDPDILAIVAWLAEMGHPSAREALRRHGTRLLEDGTSVLESSFRTYLIRLLNGLIATHPEDRSEVIANLGRDLAIVAMVDAATARWSLPKLNSSKRRHSAAFFVAIVWTARGVELTERQVRRIYQERKKLADRMRKFLLGDLGERTI